MTRIGTLRSTLTGGYQARAARVLFGGPTSSSIHLALATAGVRAATDPARRTIF